MKYLRNILVAAAAVALLVAFCCTCLPQGMLVAENSVSTYSPTFDKSVWHYDADHDVYWQLGVAYCSDVGFSQYESFGIYVPGAYMAGTENDDGTYTCRITHRSGSSGYTAQTAPIVMPLNSVGSSGQMSPTAYSYEDAAAYLQAGYVCVAAGYRGSDSVNDDLGQAQEGQTQGDVSAPWGVVDLKAAIRYLRYSGGVIPGDLERIYTCGEAGGATLATVLGASGDSNLYYDYLESIGALVSDLNGKYISDSIAGVMCWSPATGLDYADEAYEWMQGQYLDGGSRAEGTFTKALSGDMAERYATYIKRLRLRDYEGTILRLAKADDGIYTMGSYYEHTKWLIEESLDEYLANNDFPCTVHDSATGRSVVCESAQDYADFLNSDSPWVSYDPDTNTATITDLRSFVQHHIGGSVGVPVFDGLQSQGLANSLFDNNASSLSHFDKVVAELLQTNQDSYASLSGWDSSYASSWSSDLEQTDSFGNTVEERVNMYNPLYYLCRCYGGYGSSMVAANWNIESSISQGDPSFLGEMNLTLALHATGGVNSVNLSLPWEQNVSNPDHAASFVTWVGECCKVGSTS